jgi:hypothetical protein
MLKEESKTIKEKAFCAIFKSWLDVSSHKIPKRYYIKEFLDFKSKKKLLVNNVLKNNDLIINLEFLYDEPWDDLILNGIS